MNVLFLTHNFPRHAGDHAGAFVLRLAQALRERGVNIHVLAPSSRNGEAATEIDGIPVERFRYAPRRFEQLAYTGNMASDVARSWSARLALLGFLGADFASAVRARRRFSPDLIHAHWWFPGGLVGSWAAALGHVPLLTTLHGSDVRLARRVMMARPLFRHVLRHSTTVTAVSNWLADLTAKIAGVARPVVAPMPVAAEIFQPSADGAARSGMLFVGRLNQQKGLAHLLNAMAGMQTGAMLDVVGDGPLSAELRRIADRLGVAERVRWHGIVQHTALPDYYRRAAVAVVPSSGEGLGMVAAEAAMCETPVVAFASGGLGDSVRDGATGFLVPDGDQSALARSLDDVLGSPERGREMGRAGRMFALANFAPESVAEKYLDLYRKAVERGPA